MKLSIVRYPAAILRRECEEVEPPDLAFVKDWEVRARFLNKINGGYAVAAPQMGIAKRFFFYNVEGRSGMAINPTITDYGDQVVEEPEACLSILNKSFLVPRSLYVEWSWFDTDMNQHSGVERGLMSRVVQHEIDHLNGITLADK